jgi:ABC-type nitrate/sulfonate/bicarbonate transport system ATPase subunit
MDASGIGKSTLLRTLARAQPRLTGEIEIRISSPWDARRTPVGSAGSTTPTDA